MRLRHLLYILIGAAIVYVIREVRRYRAQRHPRRPDITMEEAWKLMLSGNAKHPDLALAPGGRIPDAPVQVQDQVRVALASIEQSALEQWDPYRAIRAAALSSAGVALHLEALTACDEPVRQSLINGYQAGMDNMLREAAAGATLQWLALRLYSQWKFDDAVTDDWFQNFLRVARPYVREKVRLARDHVLRVDSSAARFAEVYDKLLKELAGSLIEARPKKRFVQPDLPWE